VNTYDLAATIIKVMGARQQTLATCESITGGALGAALTDVPGASTVFRGGIVAYARDVKSSLVGVSEYLIDTEGVINEQTALEMALGAQRLCDADYSIATTGVAGPTKQDGADVGTVWLAVVGPSVGVSIRPRFTQLAQFEGDRSQIRAQTVHEMLAMLLRLLSPTGRE